MDVDPRVEASKVACDMPDPPADGTKPPDRCPLCDAEAYDYSDDVIRYRCCGSYVRDLTDKSAPWISGSYCCCPPERAVIRALLISGTGLSRVVTAAQENMTHEQQERTGIDVTHTGGVKALRVGEATSLIIDALK